MTPQVLQDEDEFFLISDGGERGPPGANGSPGSSFLHTQASAASTWTVNHNLGFRPSVEIYGTGFAVMDAEVLHISVNQCQVFLATALAGFARCN